MFGGTRSNARRRGARRLAVPFFSGLALLVAGLAAAQADERSIVTENTQAPAVEQDIALATDQGEGELEPIADASEYGLTPDLAEGALVPTLADPPGTDAGGEVADFDASGAQTSDEVDASSSISAGAAVASDPAWQAAGFNGIVPGDATRRDVLEAWGQPLEKDSAAKTLTFDVEGFQSVSVAFSGDQVASIRVELAAPSLASDLAERLDLTQFRTAVVRDEDGHVVSTNYPERGVTFGHTPALGAAIASDDPATVDDNGSEPVYELVMRPIEGAAFLRRAELASASDYARRSADLEAALELDARSVRALDLLSQAKLAIGQAVAAESLAADAVAAEPANDAYRLQWARSLQALGRRDEAVEQTRTVLEGDAASPIVRAEALETMAQLAAVGSADDRSRAMSLQTKAIELADKLAAADDSALAARAHRVLLTAHLAMAERIAAADFQSKDRSVGEWMSRASALAEHMIAQGEADVSLRVEVAISALTAGGRLNPPVDPALWIDEAEQAAAEAEPQLTDAHARDQLRWQLGRAYCYAAEIQHRRGEADLALRYGEQADAQMTPLKDARAELADADYALGRVYFQIGAVHAVHKKDHDVACQWYDRAAELLYPASSAALVHPGQHGDALVSMGVSYWEIGQRDRAYELTKAGADLVEQGVRDGLLAATSLDVPQGNLAAMAKALGKVGVEPALDDVVPTRMAQSPRAGNQPRSSRGRTPSRTADRRSANGDGAVRRR